MNFLAHGFTPKSKNWNYFNLEKAPVFVLENSSPHRTEYSQGNFKGRFSIISQEMLMFPKATLLRDASFAWMSKSKTFASVGPYPLLR